MSVNENDESSFEPNQPPSDNKDIDNPKVDPVSSPCTISTNSPPPTSPLPPLMPPVLTMDTFIPDPSLLSLMMNHGIPMEISKRALFLTGNHSAELAISLINEDDGEVEFSTEDIEAISSDDCYPITNDVIIMGEMGEVEEDSSSDSMDMEEEMEWMLVLLVNMSSNLSPGKMSIATVRSTARVTRLVKEKWGIREVRMWDMMGKSTQVRGVKDKQEMDKICEDIEMAMKGGLRFVVDHNKLWTVMEEENEREIVAVFGERQDLYEVLGNLPCLQ